MEISLSCTMWLDHMHQIIWHKSLWRIITRLARLDNWKISFDWMRDEFINTMKGAYTSLVDSLDCVNGPQAEYYQALDFSNVLSCARRPTIIDLPLTKYNDSTFGLIPFCFRNGTILPRSMGPSKSISVFQMQVYKMPPDLNIFALSPPQNWRINGTLGPPVRVRKMRCCVSFSAYFNDSIIPCKTCACGCSNAKVARTCTTTSRAILLPQQALLVPFENRTEPNLVSLVPNPLPCCGDNCGVSINWHLATDYRGGWTAFNFADWFTTLLPFK
ncbi:unnamed protein product [Arabis nemorensis]|uniref:COBRA C-terminal domain-containing protein n=1 Tax=Arabis nemorensis TaxID=586526 RepID=A0A565BHS6_9BRAS|nr:unnamed protein product [Arabis nemorensis]